MVASTISAMLRRLGQTVVWVQSSEDAITSLLDKSSVFDAMLTDLNMPGLGGEALIARVQGAGFSGKIVVLSGNISTETTQRLRTVGVAAVLQKPFVYARIQNLLTELWPAQNSG